MVLQILKEKIFIRHAHFFPSQQTIQIPFLTTNYSSDAILVLPSGKFKAEAWATCQVKIKEVKNLHSHCRVHSCFRERTLIQTDQMVVKHAFVCGTCMGIFCKKYYLEVNF